VPTVGKAIGTKRRQSGVEPESRASGRQRADPRKFFILLVAGKSDYATDGVPTAPPLTGATARGRHEPWKPGRGSGWRRPTDEAAMLAPGPCPCPVRHECMGPRQRHAVRWL